MSSRQVKEQEVEDALKRERAEHEELTPEPITGEYIDAVRESAIARKRTLYVYWSAARHKWESTVHYSMVPSGARYMSVTRYGSAWWTAGEDE